MLSGLENPLHILIICLVVLLVFGAKRLPEMGRSLGTGLREFKAGVTGQLDAPTFDNITAPRPTALAEDGSDSTHRRDLSSTA